MKRVAWSEVRSARQPGLQQELRVLIELLRVLPRPGLPMQLTILPSNIMVGDDGSVLVGAAPLGGASYQERYLAPEVQCGAEPMLPSAIYAVGALLFEAVTGHRFETRELVTQELAGARAMARAAGLGARFWEIYLLEAAAKATEEQPEARWVSGHDFAEDLERVARDRIVTRAELGRLVTEVVEGRGSSQPPKRSSGPAEAAARSGPPPLPKKVRRRPSSSKRNAVDAASSSVPSGKLRPAIPRSDGDAPQLPLITALRVPSNLKLPEAAPVAAAPVAAAPVAAAPVAAAPAAAAPVAAAPIAAPLAPSSSSDSPAPGPGRVNPVTLGPRLDPDTEPPPKAATTSVAPVVVPSLAPPPADPILGGESRRRTLTGTGDLRWLEGLQPPADVMDPARHGTLLGLGNPAPSARLEPSFPEIEAPTHRIDPATRRPTPAPSSAPPSGRSAAPGSNRTGPASQSSSPPSDRASSPSSRRSSSNLHYIHSPTLESGWDAEGGAGSRGSSDDITLLKRKKSWMGRALLAVVVLVALGIGTLEVVGHYVSSSTPGAKDSHAAASKPEVGTEPRPDVAPPQAARAREPSPPATRDSAATAANEPSVAPASEAPAAPTPPAAHARPGARHAPVRAVPPPAAPPPRAAAPPAAPPPAPAAPAPRKLPDQRDYGI